MCCAFVDTLETNISFIWEVMESMKMGTEKSRLRLEIQVSFLLEENENL
jgi:hypothetical protein